MWSRVTPQNPTRQVRLNARVDGEHAYTKFLRVMRVFTLDTAFSIPAPPRVMRVAEFVSALGSLSWNSDFPDVSLYSVNRQRTICPRRFHEQSEILLKGAFRLIATSLAVLSLLYLHRHKGV